MRTRNDAYFMIDIEASGTTLGHHDLIQFGGVAVLGSALSTRIPFPAYRARPDLPVNLVAPMIGNEPDPGAMKVNGLDWQQVCEFGERPEVFIDRFHDFVTGLKRNHGADRVVICGHGLVFDWSMLKLMFDRYRDDWPCHYSGLCLKALYAGLRGVDYIDSSMTEMQQRYGIPAHTNKHDAQGDADHQTALMLAVMREAGLVLGA